MFSVLLSIAISSSLLPFAAAAQTEHNATAVTTVGWVPNSYNKRSTISLLYNCLFTIFLCTWSAMHLNIPGENESSPCIFLRKCRWMLVGILAPEAVAALAYTEWYNAQQLARIEPRVPTISHGFLAMMGGYTIDVKVNAENNTSKRIRLRPEDFLKFAKLRSPKLPPKKELMDKSKGDWISKTITSFQVIWFIFQLVGRAVRQLPVTTLELFTCAIVVCTAATYVMWWNKPLDVRCPIFLGSKVEATLLENHRIHHLETYHSIMDNRLPGEYEMSDSKQFRFYTLIILAFTACHLIGWNFYFPTRTEQLLWRIAGVLCGAIPPLFLLLSTSPPANSTARSKRKDLLLGLSSLCIFTYFLTRAYLLVEVFIGLRSVPVDVYTAVNWSAYIPHI